LVLGDIEVPEHDVQTLEQALAISDKFNLDTLIINGDFIALDSFSTWVRSMVYKLAFKDELEPAIEILKIFLSHFDRIFLNTGNHERRLAKRVDGELTIGDFFKHLTGVSYSEYAFCYLHSGGKEILVCHQDNYSKRPLQVASDIAAVKHTNVICGHTHILSQSRDRSGKYFIVDGGSGRNPERTMYKAILTNTFPEWQLGFVMVINGVPLLINKENFGFYMGGM
jgi:predicted phosphodiesterase